MDAGMCVVVARACLRVIGVDEHPHPHSPILYSFSVVGVLFQVYVTVVHLWLVVFAVSSSSGVCGAI
jgi:hypothetical protein